VVPRGVDFPDIFYLLAEGVNDQNLPVLSGQVNKMLAFYFFQQTHGRVDIAFDLRKSLDLSDRLLFSKAQVIEQDLPTLYRNKVPLLFCNQQNLRWGMCEVPYVTVEQPQLVIIENVDSPHMRGLLVDNEREGHDSDERSMGEDYVRLSV